MSTFDSFADAPNQIRTEGQEITIRFDRTGPNTGRISWNIPTPAQGCSADTQAYNGIVITLDNKNVSLETNPSNGTVYIPDPTGDRDLHAGDSISTALVIGAFYDDKETTILDITGLNPNTPYYISGYAVDDQFRYHTEGVHAYSLDYGTLKTPDSAGSQLICFNNGDGVLGTDATGLVAGFVYEFDICIDGECYKVVLNGTDAATYDDLIEAINNAFERLSGALESPVPPNTGGYWWDNDNQKLFLWNGSQHVEVPVIVELTDPTIPAIGDYWYQPVTQVLSIWMGSPGGWVIVPNVIRFCKDPLKPACDDYWYQPGSPSMAFMWNGSVWCPLNLFDQENDPAIAVPPICGSYWYNPNTGIVSCWNVENCIWVDATNDVVFWPTDPNNLPQGTYWYDTDDSNLYIRKLTGSPPTLPLEWILIPESNISSDPCVPPLIISPTEPSPTLAHMLWFDTTNEKLFQRDITNTIWVELPVLLFDRDPTIRESCDYWWDSDSPNDLYTWSVNNNIWVLVASFIQSPIDPALDPILTEAAWYKPSTMELRIWTGTGWELVKFINHPTDPTIVAVGDIWFDDTNNTWYEWSGSAWVVFNPVDSVTDPTMLPLNSLWYDTTNNLLFTWNGVSWLPVAFSTVPFTPIKGELWYDSINNNLMMWNGTAWVIAIPLAMAELNADGHIVITSSTVGSFSDIDLLSRTCTESLKSPFWQDTPLNGIIQTRVEGIDGNEGEPSYAQVGVGDDGTPDERRELADSIRAQLGYPVVQVELTKYQMDTAITGGLEELRRRSSIGFRRGFAVLNIKPGIQRYELTNKSMEYNQIGAISGLTRLSSAFLTSAHGSGIFGQVVLQHLYNMGTFDLLSFHMVNEYTAQLEHLFASRLAFNFNETSRVLTIHSVFSQAETILMDVALERTEQDLLNDRYAKVWIEQWALSECRLMLSHIRGKYASLPGAGGGVALDAAELGARADAEKERLYSELDDYVVNNVEEWGIGAEFTWG